LPFGIDSVKSKTKGCNGFVNFVNGGVEKVLGAHNKKCRLATRREPPESQKVLVDRTPKKEEPPRYDFPVSKEEALRNIFKQIIF
jgi:hypothetical protein